MAVWCTMLPAAMHHFCGMGAPWRRCRTSGEGVCFARSGCRTTNGQGVVLARRTQPPAGIVAPRLGKQGRQFWIIVHRAFPLFFDKLGSAAPISLTCPKTTILSAASPRNGGTAARRDRRPACPMADRGRELAQPTCGAGVYRSFSVERSHRAPAARLPALCSGPPPFRCGEVYISLSNNQDIFASIPSGETAKIKKFFSCVPSPA